LNQTVVTSSPEAARVAEIGVQVWAERDRADKKRAKTKISFAQEFPETRFDRLTKLLNRF